MLFAGVRFLCVLRFCAVCREETLAHALDCLARLVRLLLGPTAIAEAKLEIGTSLCVLGVDLEMARSGFKFRPARRKVVQWVASLKAAVEDAILLPGDASKLAGKLSWGCSHLFKRFGRAMLRPLFDQKSRRDGHVSTELRRSLLWWIEVLQSGLAELRQWKQKQVAPVHLFCDARGYPPHLGAVLFIDGRQLWCHMPAPDTIMDSFRCRRDNQIMGLELLSISLGFSSFERELKGRHVVVHSDNTGAEVCALVCLVWARLYAVLCGAGLYTERDCQIDGSCPACARPMDAGSANGYESIYQAC